MEKVFGYARKSPDDKVDTENSINNQIKLINVFCEKSGWIVDKIFVDKNISGGDRFRKEFTAMISEAIDKKEIKIIVVKDQDRFARDSAFFSDTLRDLDVRDIRVFSIIKNKFLSYEDLGDMVTSLVDAHYITTQKKKADVLFQQKKEENMPPIKSPFGYRNKDKTWVIDKRKSDVVRAVYNDFINKINYRETTKKFGIKKSMYYRILENINKGVYSGYIVYTKRYKDSNKVVVREEEIKYPGKFEPIINEESFIKFKNIYSL